MKSQSIHNATVTGLFTRLAVPLACMLALGCLAAPPKKNKPDKADAVKAEPAKAIADAVEIAKIDPATFPKSAFKPAGINPFFPNASTPVNRPQIASAKQQAPPEPSFVLNGITGPPLRSAMINGRTFLQGEEGDVRIDSGAKVSIKCAEIMDESAIIEINGHRKTLKLRMGI